MAVVRLLRCGFVCAVWGLVLAGALGATPSESAGHSDELAQYSMNTGPPVHSAPQTTLLQTLVAFLFPKDGADQRRLDSISSTRSTYGDSNPDYWLALMTERDGITKRVESVTGASRTAVPHDKRDAIRRRKFKTKKEKDYRYWLCYLKVCPLRLPKI